MKATIAENSPRRHDWMLVFGYAPIEIELAPRVVDVDDAMPARYRIKLDALTVAQRRGLVRLVATRRRMPVDMADYLIAQRGCTIASADVVLVDQQQTL